MTASQESNKTSSKCRERRRMRCFFFVSLCLRTQVGGTCELLRNVDREHVVSRRGPHVRRSRRRAGPRRPELARTPGRVATYTGGATPQAKSAFAEVKTRVAMVRVSADRKGAELFVDGLQVGLEPLARALFVEPGM